MAGALWLAVTTLLAAVQPSADGCAQCRDHPAAGRPLLLTLFLLLPRLAPLWQMPSSSRALSGLSEEVAPATSASWSTLRLAFRISFAEAPPPPGSATSR